MLTTALARLRARLGPARARLALDAALAVLVYVVAQAAYATATGHIQLCDSTYSLVATEMLLKRGTLELTSNIPADSSKLPGYNPGLGLPYQFVRMKDTGRIYYGYPLGSTFLAMPWVAYHTMWKDRSVVDAAGAPRCEVEGVIQVKIASQISAAIAALLYLLARHFVRPVPALLLALGFAFGSPLASTMSRSLWSHTGMVLFLSAALVLLVSRMRVAIATLRTDVLYGLGLGTCLFWSGFCRQHAATSAVAIGLYLVLHYRRTLFFTLLGGSAWVAGLVAFSMATFGTLQPPSVYGAGMMDGEDVANRFAWLMISPTRGLLVYCPYLLAIGAILVAGRKTLKNAGLLFPAAFVLTTHSLLIASFVGWHANSAYGPRYFSDVLPWFALLASMSVAALPELPRFRWPLGILLVAGFAWGIFVHQRGANSPAAWLWNERPRMVGNEASVKEWRHPQFLTGLTFLVLPDGSIKEGAVRGGKP